MDTTASNTPWPNSTVWLPDYRYSFLLTCIVWVLIILMVVPEGLNYQNLIENGMPSKGSSISRVLWLGLLASGALITVWRMGLGWLLLRNLNLFLILFVLLAAVSILWSVDRSLTARRLIRLGTILLVCTAFVIMSWHTRRFQNVVRPVLTLLLLGSIIFGLVWPELGIHQQTSPELLGAWRGLANHKNALGALACFGMIFWVHAWLAGEVKLKWAFFGCGVAATCLILSRSSTSLGTAIVVCLMLALLMRSPQGLRPYLNYLIVLLVVVAVLYALAILNLIPGSSTLLKPIAALTGKDLTFTGRTDIWAIITEHISHRPLLGTGYGAYWAGRGAPGTESYTFITRLNFYPGSAHNGYLEILNDLGWIGLLCLLGYLATYVWQSMQLLNTDWNQAVLYLALFFQQSITNLSETHWLSVLSVDFVIMGLATTTLGRCLLERHLRTAFGGAPSPSPSPSPHSDEPESRPRQKFFMRLEPGELRS